ncbi:hypothetical protein Vi05172_g150 [Venturia inaequalis]|nr:hypothetical protein Vi05172_g150 [Venturia inaequalis]
MPLSKKIRKIRHAEEVLGRAHGQIDEQGTAIVQAQQLTTAQMGTGWQDFDGSMAHASRASTRGSFMSKSSDVPGDVYGELGAGFVALMFDGYVKLTGSQGSPAGSSSNGGQTQADEGASSNGVEAPVLTEIALQDKAARLAAETALQFVKCKGHGYTDEQIDMAVKLPEHDLQVLRAALKQQQSSRFFGRRRNAPGEQRWTCVSRRSADAQYVQQSARFGKGKPLVGPGKMVSVAPMSGDLDDEVLMGRL